MADRIFVLNAGRIEQIGTPSEIYRKPASTFVASFMGAPPMNLLPATSSGGGTIQVGDHAIGTGQPIDKTGPVQLGIRPEEVNIVSSGGLPFTLDLIEELGASRLFHGKLAGEPFTVNAPNDTEVSGDTLSLDLPRTSLHVFDGGTGLRL